MDYELLRLIDEYSECEAMERLISIRAEIANKFLTLGEEQASNLFRAGHLHINEKCERLESGGGKPFPTLSDTVEATLDRLPILRGVLDFLAEMEEVIGVVLGGSMSYGQFFSVRKYPPSDIDLLISMKDWPRSLNRLMAMLEQKFTITNMEEFQQRINFFLTHSEIDPIKMIFSQKFRFKGDHDVFNVSFHLLSPQIMDRYFLEEVEDLAILKNTINSVWEYRQVSYAPIVIHDFDGNQLLNNSQEIKVYGGYLSEVHIWAVRSNRFLTGQYQNLIFPCLNVIIDKSWNLKMKAGLFANKLRRRFDWEKEFISPSGSFFNIHYRHAAFNPLLIKEIWP